MNRLLTLILAGLSMVGPLAIDTYLPSFPAISKAFEVGPLLMQQSLSLFLFTFAFMMLFYGTLSDSFGRRPVILVSLVIYTLASLGAAVAPSFGWLLVCRVFQGLASGAGSVVSRAIVQDKFSGAEAQRMLSHIMMLFGLAPAIAPVLGGWLQVSLGWRSVFWFLTSFGVLMLVVCYRALPESLPVKSRHAFHPVVIAANYWKVLRHHRFLLMALAVGLSFSGFALYIGSAANFVMNILHKPETAFAWLFIPLISGMVAGSAMSAKHASRYTPRRMILIGYAIMAAATVLNVGYNYFFAAEVPWAVLPLFLYAFGLALITPAATIIAMGYFPDNRGLASSLQSFVQMFMFALVSGFVAPILFESAFKLACGVAGGLCLSFVCWLLGQPKQSDLPMEAVAGK
ncbi:multidrug effflux MFS transporter [Undibacterium sp.]|jgi:DHA1 family bicyclomycin/chloramphenicol resistance-like MFS transporter|uniref:multidrug effflux MFS transporter n=1 Tax=Undibacterium sp. TaxID=1914977 RepID=UPI002C20DA36|nr:multidrug effflux MFS transporter [Undibacterium sp.]HTD06411.1 multidrug effflux MFS transporter [Undibacterium sp.]